jgi:hypothetical protein
MKADISFWNGATSLRGISVRSLSAQLISDAIVFAYLYREGSSLLVLVPQGGYTLVVAWKMLIASGIRWRRVLFVVPVPYRDAALAASANEHSTSAFDREAVGYMWSLLLPLVLGYAAYALVFKGELCEWTMVEGGGGGVVGV